MRCWWWPAGVVAETCLQPRARFESGAGPWGPPTVASSTNPRIRSTPWSLPPAFDEREEQAMKQIRDRVADLDVHKETVVACTRISTRGGGVEVAKERFTTTQSG